MSTIGQDELQRIRRGWHLKWSRMWVGGRRRQSTVHSSSSRSRCRGTRWMHGYRHWPAHKYGKQLKNLAKRMQNFVFFLPANEMRNLLFCVWNGSYARILKWNANLARIQLEECKTLLISCCVCNANLAWASQIKANLDLFVFVVFSSCLFLLFSVY